MTLLLFVASAVLLSIERVAYVFIWHHPATFRVWCVRTPLVRLGQPIDVVRWLFVICKAIQAAVFTAWIYLHSGGTLRPSDVGVLTIAAGGAFILVGQVFNLMVFRRLGTTGVFYGNRFGHEVPWCRTFPFSVVSHPQYVGTVLSIWGLFLIMRFPYSDWYLLPALETAYYLGARFEQ
jgi:methylene-fatty-acyl-phospholipid synthase